MKWVTSREKNSAFSRCYYAGRIVSGIFSCHIHRFWGPWGGFCSEYCLVIRVCGRLSGRRNSDGPRRGKVGLVCRVVSLIPTVKCPDERAFSNCVAWMIACLRCWKGAVAYIPSRSALGLMPSSTGAEGLITDSGEGKGSFLGNFGGGDRLAIGDIEMFDMA